MKATTTRTPWITGTAAAIAAAAVLMAGCEAELPSSPEAEPPVTAQVNAAPHAEPAQMQIPHHPHALLHNAEIRWLDEGEPPVHGMLPYEILGFDRCVELANARAVPLHAHHGRVHFGTAGQKLAQNAGHFVVPLAPFGVGWGSCADLEAEVLGA